MIRLIQKKLIIPRGDTGSFSIPALAAASNADAAVFTIFDCMTHSRLFQKKINISGDTLTFEFTHEETVNWKPGKYVWDIKFYKNPTEADGEVIDGDEVDSYYAGYQLPECEIRETGDSLLVSDDAAVGALSPNQLNIITSAISSITAAVQQTEANVSHYPKIENDKWYVWDASAGDYNDSGVVARGQGNVRYSPEQGLEYYNGTEWIAITFGD